MNKGHIIFILVSVFAIAIIPFVFDVYYTTPDDPRYIALVSGAYTGTPENELVFVGSMLGFFEAKLYSYFPGFEWYSIIYYIFTLSAFATILWQVLISGLGKWRKIALAVLVLITQVYLSLTPQFTTLATQLGFASFILQFSRNGGRKRFLLSLLLFLFAVQVRLAAAFIPYMIACPLFLKDINLKSSVWWKEKSWLIGVVLVAAVSFGVDKYAYRSEEWKTFNSINDARGYIADNPMAINYSNEIKDEEDRLAFDLYYRYRIFDLNILTPEKLNGYMQVFKDRTLDTIRFNGRDYLKTYWNMGGWMVVLLSLWLFYELIRKHRWFALFLCGASIGMFALANLNMMSTSFAKERVMLCSYVALLFTLLCIVSVYSRYSRAIIIAVCAISSIQYLCKDYECIKDTTTPRPIIAETEMMIEKVKDSKVMLPVPTYLTPEAFHTSQSPIYTNSIIQGWMHFYPKADLRYQPFTAFTDGLPILVVKSSMDQLDIIQKLLKLHYGIDSKQVVLSESDNYCLVKIEKV